VVPPRGTLLSVLQAFQASIEFRDHAPRLCLAYQAHRERIRPLPAGDADRPAHAASSWPGATESPLAADGASVLGDVANQYLPRLCGKKKTL